MTEENIGFIRANIAQRHLQIGGAFAHIINPGQMEINAVALSWFVAQMEGSVVKDL